MDFIKLDISSLTKVQLKQMEEMERNCGLEPFSRRMLLESVSQMDTYAMLDHQQIAGFITIHQSAHYLGESLYIVNLNVSQEYRRQGVATRLILASCSSYAQTHGDKWVTLDVRKDNTAATALYRKLGFEIMAEPSANGATDVVMAGSMEKLLGIVKTPRLLLKRITARDAEEGIRIYREERVNKTYMFPDLTEDAARKLHDRISALSANDGRYVRGIYLENKMVGFINDPEILGSTIELGWVVDPEYHNRGYATEAVTYAIEDLFSRGYKEITAGAFEENPASIRVMQKSGMHLIEKTEEIDYRGKIHHCIFYAIEREAQ